MPVDEVEADKAALEDALGQERIERVKMAAQFEAMAKKYESGLRDSEQRIVDKVSS